MAERWIAEQMHQDHALQSWQLGFHSIPSMRQLHMHVISQVCLQLSPAEPRQLGLLHSQLSECLAHIQVASGGMLHMRGVAGKP